MRSLTKKEGSVGLLALVGLGLFGSILLWLTGAQFGKRTYSFIVVFDNANGMKVGSSVVFRGSGVGKITRVVTASNRVEVVIEITQSNLVMDSKSKISVNQSGLIAGESSVAIIPKTELSDEALKLDPLASNCNNQIIICNGSRIKGDFGVSVNELLLGTQKASKLYTSEEFFNNINSLAKNSSEAAAGIAKLTREFSGITGDIREFTANTNRTVERIGDAATIASLSTSQAAFQIGGTAEQYGTTGVQLNQLLANVNSLVVENRGTLATTLNDLSQTSSALRATVVELRPALDQFASGQILQNLETLSANAAEASRNLRDVSGAVNNPTTLVMLQQTLDSARVTFNNVQKITADLDELTGDPQFRSNLRQLINGLGNLVSSSEQIQQQMQVAQQLQQITPAIAYPANPLAINPVPSPALTPTPSPFPEATPSPPIWGINSSQLANNYPNNYLNNYPNNYQVLPRRELNMPNNLDRTP